MINARAETITEKPSYRRWLRASVVLFLQMVFMNGAEKKMVNSGLVSSEERTAVRIRWSLGYVAGCRW
jgi:hypothetical protein